MKRQELEAGALAAERALTAERLRLGLGNPVLTYALHYHRNDRGDRLSFSGRPWLLALYEMWGAEPPRGADVVFQKATQVGISEHMLVLAWAWCGELGYRLMYVLPRDEDRTAFYAMRVKKPLRHTPRYQSLTRQTSFDSRSEYLMSIGRGFFRLAASNAEASFVSVPLDAYILDELDQCDQTNVLMAEDRLAWADSRKVRIRVGNPTVSDFGISALYEGSSKHRWCLTCPSCGKEDELDFFRHVVKEKPGGGWEPLDEDRAAAPAEGDLRAMCEECGAPLDRGAGRWLAQHPERSRRGFHISKLIDGATPLRGIVEQHAAAQDDPKLLQRFYNAVLGLPYTPAGGKLTLALIKSRRFRYADLGSRLWAPVRTMGIDVGSPSKVVVSDLVEGAQRRQIEEALGRPWKRLERGPAHDPQLDKAPEEEQRPRALRRLLGAWEVRNLREVDRLVERFRPRCICIDALPEIEAVVAARKRWGRLIGGEGRVWRVQYLFDQVREIGLDHSSGLAKIDRTYLLDLSARDWQEGYRICPMDVEELVRGAYCQELIVPTRVEEETSRGIPVFRWTKGKDHFFHADAYDRLAAELCRHGLVTSEQSRAFEGL